MPIVWKFKKWLAAERDIYRPSELQAVLIEKLGVEISIQALSSLMNETPQGMRMQTMLAICTALNCKLSDFFDVLPDNVDDVKLAKTSGEPPSKLYGGRRENESSIFPDPRDFSSRPKDKDKD